MSDSETTDLVPSKQASQHRQLMAWLAGECHKQGFRETMQIELYLARAAGRAGRRGEPVATWFKDDSEGELFELQQMANFAALILRTAENACEHPGPQRFSVAAVNKHDGRAFHAITVEGPDMAIDDDTSAAAQIAQQIRHNEALLQMQLRSQAAVVESLAAENQRKDQRIEGLEKKLEGYWEEREKAASMQAEREMAAFALEQSEKRKDMVYEKISKLAPVVLNHFAGRKVLEAKSAKEILLADFAESLKSDPDRLNAIMGALLPRLKAEERIQLLNLLQDEKPASNTQPNGVSNDEVDHAS